MTFLKFVFWLVFLLLAISVCIPEKPWTSRTRTAFLLILIGLLAYWSNVFK